MVSVMTNVANERQKLQIEMWADVICPWCGLGDHRLRQALELFEHKDDVEVVRHSFQLDPNFPTDATRSVRSMLRERYDMADDEIVKANRHLEEVAAAEGLDSYNVAENEVGNTALAHELLAFAADRGLGDVAWKKLFDAHFGQTRSVFHLESLVDIGEEIGLSQESTRTVLGSRIYAQQIEDEAAIAKELGATGVPFFVFDSRYAVAGAHSCDALLDVLNRGMARVCGGPRRYSPRCTHLQFEPSVHFFDDAAKANEIVVVTLSELF